MKIIKFGVFRQCGWTPVHRNLYFTLNCLYLIVILIAIIDLFTLNTAHISAYISVLIIAFFTHVFIPTSSYWLERFGSIASENRMYRREKLSCRCRNPDYVPLSTELYTRCLFRFRLAIDPELKQEAEEWCEQMFAAKAWYSWIGALRHGSKKARRICLFLFRSKKNASIFKLRWSDFVIETTNQ